MLFLFGSAGSGGNSEKFTALYRRYRGLMYSAAYSILRSTEDAEDAVQEAFLSIYENISKISEEDCPKTRAFVVIITERKALNILKKRTRHPEAELTEQEPFPERADAGLSPLAEAMAKLPQKYRDPLILKYGYGFSAGEIARMLDLTAANAQKLIDRGREKLRTYLEEKED